ncbi:hypothetical protein U8V72_25790 [Priestia filamentosa]|uniref:hypothetical protein n=1 Tax=Priestia filamentosa TaxID=1402861 RepID=UPI00397A67CF
MKENQNNYHADKELANHGEITLEELQTLPPEELLKKIRSQEKLKIILENRGEIVLLQSDQYKASIHHLNEQEKVIKEQQETIERYESLLEDIQLSNEYGEGDIKLEQGLTPTYKVNSIEEAFELIDKAKQNKNE